jgi:hypothetical protein
MRINECNRDVTTTICLKAPNRASASANHKLETATYFEGDDGFSGLFTQCVEEGVTERLASGAESFVLTASFVGRRMGCSLASSPDAVRKAEQASYLSRISFVRV